MPHKHIWQLVAVGNKVWVTCRGCSDRFPFTSEFNGATYWGLVPEKYRQTDA